MVPSEPQRVVVEGRSVQLTNLDKVLFPQSGTTKGEVLAYYAAAAVPLLRELAGRPVTRKRWPHGVGTPQEPGMAFFEKNLPPGAPEWVESVVIQHETATTYPLVSEIATLIWLGQLAVLELHAPQWRFVDGVPAAPDRLVLDLDPGPQVTLAGCAEVALRARDLLTAVGLASVPVTSGSKGIHLYAELDGSFDAEQATELARGIADALVTQTPSAVTASMSKAARVGKVFLDWSQNNGSKNTIVPYSLRGGFRPLVAFPRSWEEISSPDLAQLELAEALSRLTSGDNPLSATPAAESTPAQALPTQRIRVLDPIPPMLAEAATEVELRDPQGWSFEMKWDGIRILAHRDGTDLRLYGRRGRDETARYPELAAGLLALPCHDAVIDGEIVATDPSGAPKFGLLQSRINLSRPGDIAAAAAAAPVQLMAFDLLHLDGRSLRCEPYHRRRAALTRLMGAGTPLLHLPPSFADDLESPLAASRQFGLEGVMAKRTDSTYQAGVRSRTWLKLKHRHTQSVVVCGWQPGKGSRNHRLGSLILAIPQAGELRYVGRVGSGFTEAGLAEAEALLAAFPSSERPLTGVPAEDLKDARWVEPVAVGEVYYNEFTDTHRLRHPVWKGWRIDLQAEDVRWE